MADELSQLVTIDHVGIGGEQCPQRFEDPGVAHVASLRSSV
jgi:hypothetical protein